MNVRLYLLQRATAAVMAPLVMVHIAVIFYATRHGMNAADILSRTRGSIAWAAFYGLFVLAVSIHAAIGVRNILTEWTPLPERRVDGCVGGFSRWCIRLDLRDGIVPGLRWRKGAFRLPPFFKKRLHVGGEILDHRQIFERTDFKFAVAGNLGDMGAAGPARLAIDSHCA